MWGRQTVNNQASFVKQFLGDSSFFFIQAMVWDYPGYAGPSDRCGQAENW